MSAAIRARELLARLPEGPVVGAEIGVWRGEMSAILLRERPDMILRMVDSWAAPEYQPEHYRATDDFHATASEAEQFAWMAEAHTQTKFAVLRSSLWRMASVDAAWRVLDRGLDFVFIDGDHSYEGTMADIAAWLPKLKPGGLLSGHDYHPEKNARKGFGECRAVDEAVELHGWTLELGENDTWFVRLPG